MSRKTRTTVTLEVKLTLRAGVSASSIKDEVLTLVANGLDMRVIEVNSLSVKLAKKELHYV